MGPSRVVEPSISHLLTVAAGQVGVTEWTPPGRVGEYRSLVGLSPYWGPWALAFTHWVGVTALAERWPLPREGLFRPFSTTMQATGWLRNRPAPGALFVVYSKHCQLFVHCGYCVERSGTGWLTIEGNTDLNLPRRGSHVTQRTRVFGDRDRFLWWWRPPRVLNDVSHTEGLCS